MNVYRLSIAGSPSDICHTREPDPQLYKRVRLGDVGYTRKGRFILLFSAGEPLGSRELGVDVPATFEPLDVGLVVRGVPRMPGSLCTGTVRELGAGVDDSTMTVGRCACRF